MGVSFGAFVKSYMGESSDMAETHILITVDEYKDLKKARADLNVYKARAILARLRKSAALRERDGLDEANRYLLERVQAAERGENELNIKIAKLERVHEYYVSMARDYWRLRMELGTHPGQVVDRMKAEGRIRWERAEARRNFGHALGLGHSSGSLKRGEVAEDSSPNGERQDYGIDWDVYYGTADYEIPDDMKTDEPPRILDDVGDWIPSSPVAMFPGFTTPAEEPLPEGMYRLFTPTEITLSGEVGRLKRRVDYLEKVRARLIKNVWGHGRHT